METTETLLLLRCEQALHAGTGIGIGAIDKPIQRDKTTGFPIVYGSALKGSIKSQMRPPKTSKQEPDFFSMFGSDDDGSIAAASTFTEAHLLLFPVRSARGLFTWVTCPFALNRFLNKGRSIGKLKSMDIKVTEIDIDENAYLLAEDIDKCMVIKGLIEQVENGKNILRNWAIFEDLCFEVKEHAELKKLGKQIADLVFDNKKQSYWHNHLQNNLILVTNKVFQYFTKFAVEIRTRNKIDINSNTASDTGLFVVECLPELSVLYATVAVFHDDAVGYTKSFIEPLTVSQMQTGGSFTTGKGQINVRIIS